MTDLLADRAVLVLSGSDRASFLQGLTTNDVTALTPDNALWSAVLTPQGRVVSAFFLFAAALDGRDVILIDAPRAQADELARRLSRFRLRADVAIEPTDLRVLAGTDDPPRQLPDRGALRIAPDPRADGAGWRAIVRQTPADAGDGGAWNARRIALGLPEAEDFEEDRTLALEADMDLLHGVSWSKGCYMGQEITARTHYRGLLRRRLLPVRIGEGAFPETGGALFAGEREVGTLRSRAGDRALAFLRREAWNDPRLNFEGVPVSVVWPDWFPAELRNESREEVSP